MFKEYLRNIVSVFGLCGIWYLLFAEEIKYVYLHGKFFALKWQNEPFWMSTYLVQKSFLFATFDYFLDDLRGFLLSLIIKFNDVLYI